MAVGSGNNLKKSEIKSIKSAKKREQKAKSRAEKGAKGSKSIIVFIIIFLIIVIGSLTAIVALNLFNVREGVLQKIPIVKNVIPAKDNEASGGEFENVDRKVLVAEIEKLRKEKEELMKGNAALLEVNDSNVLEIGKLQELESEVLAFREEKRLFDEEIVMGDKVEFSKYYKSISPDNAERIFSEIAGEEVTSKKAKDYVDTYAKMDAGAGAKVFSEMIATDLDLVVEILVQLKPEKRAEILSELSATDGAIVTKRMTPQN